MFNVYITKVKPSAIEGNGQNPENGGQLDMIWEEQLIILSF
jgi:hypothetical protein